MKIKRKWKKIIETGENKEKGRQLYGTTFHSENILNIITSKSFKTFVHKYYFVSAPGNLS